MMATKVGATAASKIPRKSLETRRPVKLWAATMPQRIAPQQKTMNARNLPIGNLTRMYATSGWKTSWATYTTDPSHEYWSPLRPVSVMRPKTDAYESVFLSRDWRQ
jgi:hypothetical protein